MMLLACMVILLFVIPESLSFECCKGNYCDLPQNTHKEITTQPSNEILLPRAKQEDGVCYCKENAGKYVKCLGHSCRSIPKTVNFTLPTLWIVTTLITTIKPHDFEFYTFLEDMKIENNDNLNKIEELSFEELVNLVNMSISYNQNIKYLEPKTFAGLVSLRKLSLLKNGFHSIKDFSASLNPKYLPTLQELLLRDNDFPVINSNDFAPMDNSSLKRLDISRCRLEYIDFDSLLYFKELDELELGVNQISPENITILTRTMLENNIPLKFLSLRKLGLRKRIPNNLLEVIGNSSIECLDLAGNHFEVIDKNAFPPMKSITFIDFREVDAVDIKAKAFDNIQNLNILLLDHNKFSVIPPGATVKTLTHLNIKANSDANVPNSYFTVHNFTFAEMSQMTVLDLSYNTILALFNATFTGLENLEVLSLKKCNILHIGPRTFLPLKSLSFLDLEENQFAQSVFSPLKTNMFDGLENLQYLYLGYNNISVINNVTFSGLQSLKYLGLNNNNLKHWFSEYISPMPSLKVLNLDRNSIVPWLKRTFDKNRNLTSVYLSNNKITNFTRAMFEDFGKLSSVILSKNNFICDCQMYNMFHMWYDKVNASKSVFKIYRNSGGKCFPNEVLISDYFEDEENKNVCRVNYTSLIALCSALFIFFVGFSILLYYYRWHWRYYLFLTRLHLIRKGRKKTKSVSNGYSNFEYDAFVSYSNEDSNFVIRLVSMLENYEPYLKLCVYERDFRIGSIISEAILESVTKSRKILLIISESYVKSHWCQWETHIAQHCNLFFKDENGDFADDSLILIKLDSVNEKTLTPTLKYLLKTRIYLQWEKEENKQKLFWNRLRNNLALEASKMRFELT